MGDILRLNPPLPPELESSELRTLPAELIPQYSNYWEIGVLYGPHGAPDFFTNEDIEMFFNADWEVHYNSARTGVRLIGPKPAVGANRWW